MAGEDLDREGVARDESRLHAVPGHVLEIDRRAPGRPLKDALEELATTALILR